MKPAGGIQRPTRAAERSFSARAVGALFLSEG